MRFIRESSMKMAWMVFSVVCTLSVSAFGQPWDGSGTEGDPYEIWTAEDMQAIGGNSAYWGAHFKLMADIDLSAYTGTEFNVIGYYDYPDNNPFTGVFDGNGHTISNFTYTSTGTSYIGLFGYVDGPGTEIKDLGLINPNVDAGNGSGVGSLVGVLWEEVTVTNCYAEGGSVSGDMFAGGLVGYVSWGSSTISDCYSTGSVSGDNTVGGLVGVNYGTIKSCYSAASVSGTWNVGGLAGGNGRSGSGSGGGITINCYAAGSVSGVNKVGGLVGDNYKSIVRNCYSTGSVTGVTEVGGLVGSNGRGVQAGGYGMIANCYSTGIVVGASNVGGLVGINDDGTVSASFWDTQTSGRSNMCGTGGANGSGCDPNNGLTTAEMQDNSTFLAAGWDFVGEYGNGPSDHWAEPEAQGYMILWWQLDPLPPLPTFSGGAGTESEPYLISNGTDLNRIGHNPRLMNKHFKLIDDIDLSGSEIWSIGSKAFPFAGVFDGNGHTISNFTYDASGLSWPDNYYIGLFGYITYPANIKDLGLINPIVDAGTGDYVGSLVGYIGNGTISGCYVEGGSVSGDLGVGGLVGSNGGTIRDCYSTASVSGSGGWSSGWSGGVGGLAGSNDGTITNCYSAGSVTGTVKYIGGLVGYNDGTISNSNSAGSVSGNDCVGGLVGYGGGLGGDGGTIINCYSTAVVIGNDRVGGLMGYNFYRTITNCYATGDVSGADTVGGLVGGNEGGTITTCYSAGNVTGGTAVGGLVGENYRSAIIDDCYARGDATALHSVGGLVGRNLTYVDPYTGDRYYSTITNCYSVGAVTAFIGDTDIGGLVGFNDGQVTGLLWDAETSGRSNMCGSQGAEGSGCDDGYGKTTAQMQTESTFTSAGWDFVGETVNGPNDIWYCDETNYPQLSWEAVLSADIDMDELWMYQNLPSGTNAKLTATVSITDDPLSNSSYSYEWEFILPDDVTIAPTITDGGGFSDPCCTFAAPSCNESGGISDSGQPLTVKVTVTGDDYANSGSAEVQFGIALLGDVNNDGVVNVADRSIINAFWRLGAAGPFTFTDCNINCDTAVNVADRSIANAVWRGVLGANSVTTPCPLR